ALPIYNAPVDLLLPAPGYLEIEAVSLADMGQITRSQNPAASNTINELMRLFYTLGWIHPNTADLPYWNNAAQELLTSLQEHSAPLFDPKAVNIDHLNKEISNNPTQLEQRIAALFESRKEIKRF
ncbi:MAG: hypothetical protein RBS43_11510, partial [Candidatus Cloacimonas sp.]|nr:hypothetical protein [Candidatus Cloacimonas sp.]